MATDFNKIVSLGDDQKSSQFLLTLDPIPGVTGDIEELMLRMDQSFDPPQRITGTYEFYTQGMKFIRSNSVEDTDKRFPLSFRLDQNWRVWNLLNAWWKFVYDEELGTFRSHNDTKTTMSFQAYGPSKEAKYVARYEGTRIINLKPTAFEQAGAEPTRIEAEFIYDLFKD